MLTLVIAGLTAVLDQIVKLIVQGNMELERPFLSSGKSSI